MPRRPRTRTLAPLAALLLAGCGSATVSELPPPAEPAASPELTQPPAGTVVDVGGPPAAVAFAGGRLGVALDGRPSLVLVDPLRTAISARVRLPGQAAGLAPAPRPGRLLAALPTVGRVVEVSVPEAEPAGDVEAGGEPRSAIAAGGRILVTDVERGAVEVVRAGRVTRRLPVGPAPRGVAAVDGGRRVAVVAARRRTLELFETGTGRRVASVPAGVGPTRVVSEARFHRLYVTDTQGDALLVFETEPELELVRRVHLPGRPYAIAVDGRAHRLWVTMTASNRLVELPAHGRPHPLRSLPAVRQPDSVAVDERSGRVFVGGRHDGVVQIVEP